MEEFKTRYDYLKLSSESKPTSEAVDGSTLYEVDTGDFYIFYQGQWYKQQ